MSRKLLCCVIIVVTLLHTGCTRQANAYESPNRDVSDIKRVHCEDSVKIESAVFRVTTKINMPKYVGLSVEKLNMVLMDVIGQDLGFDTIKSSVSFPEIFKRDLSNLKKLHLNKNDSIYIKVGFPETSLSYYAGMKCSLDTIVFGNTSIYFKSDTNAKNLIFRTTDYLTNWNDTTSLKNEYDEQSIDGQDSEMYLRIAIKESTIARIDAFYVHQVPCWIKLPKK